MERPVQGSKARGAEERQSFLKKRAGRLAFFLLVLPLLTWMVARGVDRIALSRWDSEDFAVITVEKIVGVTTESPEEGDGWQTERIAVEISRRSGPERGTTGTIEAVRLTDSKLALLPGREYLLLSDTFDDGEIQYSISDRYRIPAVAAFITAACLILAGAAGLSGIKAMAGLFLSLLLLLGWFVPRAAEGFSPIPLAILAVAGVSLVTIVFVVRSPGLWPIPFLGALGGITAASAAAWLMVELWQLTGLDGDSAALLSSMAPALSMKGLLLAAIIVGSIGAVLDVAISISSSMAELFLYDPGISGRRLWQGGISVGKEILGSMINTLLLAYLGSSLPFAVLIALEGIDLLSLLNDPHIAQEILRSLAGTMGLLLTIPLTALAAVWWLGRRRKGSEGKKAPAP